MAEPDPQSQPANNYVVLERPYDRVVFFCSRCKRAMFEGDLFCCLWSHGMFERYFRDPNHVAGLT